MLTKIGRNIFYLARSHSGCPLFITTEIKASHMSMVKIEPNLILLAKTPGGNFYSCIKVAHLQNAMLRTGNWVGIFGDLRRYVVKAIVRNLHSKSNGVNIALRSERDGKAYNRAVSVDKIEKIYDDSPSLSEFGNPRYYLEQVSQIAKGSITYCTDDVDNKLTSRSTNKRKKLSRISLQLPAAKVQKLNPVQEDSNQNSQTIPCDDRTSSDGEPGQDNAMASENSSDTVDTTSDRDREKANALSPQIVGNIKENYQLTGDSIAYGLPSDPILLATPPEGIIIAKKHSLCDRISISLNVRSYFLTVYWEWDLNIPKILSDCGFGSESLFQSCESLRSPKWIHNHYLGETKISDKSQWEPIVFSYSGETYAGWRLPILPVDPPVTLKF